ncbi:hypothetical protein Daus18300_010633 [Diaporthe australafricana]|uniref:Zn(2)-C6 fungal-type domain-containing protein n=1 Tax=Diaporthe australafricana TaxID=127596 RepID=A0ABR3W9U0_9PEZI
MSQEQSIGPGQSACNQCCAAKGEREGCARCKTLHTECIYTQSRVGKVPGIRARTKKPEQQQLRRQQQQGRGESEGGRVSEEAAAGAQHVNSDAVETIVAMPSMRPSEGTVPDPSQQALCAWPQHWPLSTPWIDAPILDDSLLEFDTTMIGEPSTASSGHLDASYDRESTSPSAAAPSSVSSGWLESTHNRTSPDALPPEQTCPAPDAARGLPSPQSAPHSTQTPPQPDEMPQTGSDGGRMAIPAGPDPATKGTGLGLARLDSECVMVCTHIIAVLENYLLCEPKTIYIVLEPTRKATAELKNLIQLQQESRCDRCISLFAIILSQMIDLLEAGAKPPSESEAGLPAGRFLYGMQSNFGLSAFSFTADEQRGWQSRIARKEYRAVAELVSTVMQMAESGPRGTAVTPTLAEQRTRPLAELKQKLILLAREKENEINLL